MTHPTSAIQQPTVIVRNLRNPTQTVTARVEYAIFPIFRGFSRPNIEPRQPPSFDSTMSDCDPCSSLPHSFTPSPRTIDEQNPEMTPDTYATLTPPIPRPEQRAEHLANNLFSNLSASNDASNPSPRSDASLSPTQEQLSRLAIHSPPREPDNSSPAESL